MFAGKACKSARSEAYFWVRRNDEGCGAMQHADFLRSRQSIIIDLKRRHDENQIEIVIGSYLGWHGVFSVCLLDFTGTGG